MPGPLSPITAEFGGRLRLHRQKRGWSQEALAERAGLHYSYVSQVERGERNLSLHNIVRLACALEIDPGRLLDGIRPND